ncbi:IS701 family transposase [Streptomyces sp. NPDC058676]|uniref:IS701 family transposase n=1 Tax=unclassified Streptomyces TaxID=2593676 RepID=UPI00366807EF
MTMGSATLIPEAVRANVAESLWWDEGILADFSAALFVSLARSDQRRKGADYLRGLLGVSGRRSIRNIAALIGGSATEQSLHHFICSSTWDWTPVRQALAAQLVSRTPPVAWVVHSMVIPKAGENSVGVDRQYVPEVGRVVNAQRAVGVWGVSEQVGTPVNWRMHLSPSWMDDEERRRQASIPDHLDNQTVGDMTIDACLETARDWRLPRRPVVLDARTMDVPSMVRRFRSAGVHFVARVAPSFPLTVTDPFRASRGPATQAAGQLATVEHDGLRPVVVREPGRNALHAYVASLLGVRLPGTSPRTPAGGPLALVGVGESRRRWPRELWLTDMPTAPLPALVGWSRLPAVADRDFRRITDRLGIRDFTGRSYGGWHRHVTLASAAHAVSALGAPSRRRAA